MVKLAHMATLSLGMIVKNEQRTLARLLAQVSWLCDQMVVVDTGSCDQTVEIATYAGAEVHHFSWTDDFAAARNHAFSLCRCEWIIWLDADDVVPPPAQQALCQIKKTLLNDPELAAVMIPYHLDWDEEGRVREQFLRERILRRGEDLFWYGRVHEVLNIPSDGIVSRHDLWVEHRPHPGNLARKIGRNLAIYESFIDVDAADISTLYQYACELQWNGRYSDACGVFDVMFARAGKCLDPTGTFYLARLKAGECHVLTGRPDIGLCHYQVAIGLDSSRAEAFCLAGELCVQQNHLARAVDYLRKAVGCQMPISSDKQIFSWFYGERPKSALVDAMNRL